MKTRLLPAFAIALTGAALALTVPGSTNAFADPEGVLEPGDRVPIDPGFGGPIVGPGPQEIMFEPVLMYNQSGGTLVGPVHRNLVVYNNGFVSYANMTSAVFIPIPSVEEVRTAYVAPERIRALRNALARAGASRLGDSNQLVLDVPLSTVTFFAKPMQQSRANTFSYFIGGERYSEVSVIINDFIQEVFPVQPSLAGE